MQAFGRNQISVRVSEFRCQVKKTQDLNRNTSSQETGTSFLRYGAALWVVQHPYALFIAISIFFIQPFRKVTFDLPHQENPLLP